MDRFEAVVLCDVLSSHYGHAMRALDTDHLARLLMLQDVASRTFYLTVWTGVACHTLHLIAVTIVVLQDLMLLKSIVTEQALQE